MPATLQSPFGVQCLTLRRGRSPSWGKKPTDLLRVLPLIGEQLNVNPGILLLQERTVKNSNKTGIFTKLQEGKFSPSI